MKNPINEQLNMDLGVQSVLCKQKKSNTQTH